MIYNQNIIFDKEDEIGKYRIDEYGNKVYEYDPESECYIWGNGRKEYYKIGTYLWHRIDGPAVEYSGGHKNFWINNIHYNEKDYWREIEIRKRNLNLFK